MSVTFYEATREKAAFTFKLMQWMKFMKFVECIWPKTDYFTGNFGANMIKHISKKELYIILSTFGKDGIKQFDHKISAIQPLKMVAEFSMEKSYFVYVFGNKVIEIGIYDPYSMKFSW